MPSEQLEFFPGRLFPEHFLTEGIEEVDEWKAATKDPSFEEFCNAVRAIFDRFPTDQEPNEAQTEKELIVPVLEALGWSDILPQQAVDRSKDTPDLLLFQDEASRQKAQRNRRRAYLHGLSIVESKRYGLPLESSPGDGAHRESVPSSQLLRYLNNVSSATDGKIGWGMLTNGAVWRLYCQDSRPRIEGFYEVDLARLAEAGECKEKKTSALRLFWLFFRRQSFILKEGERESFLEKARRDGKRFEAKVAEDLSGIIFSEVFPDLARALSSSVRDVNKDELRDAALVFLYRVLFILYAEDRNLLPVNEEGYREYSLREKVRDDIARRIDNEDTFSDTAHSYFNHICELCRMINEGDESIGLPPYNGGLFAEAAAPLLKRAPLSDSALAPVIDNLCQRGEKGQRVFVSYRSLSVQQLGSIYERLLEQEIVKTGSKLRVRPNAYARRDSGSYYTPQELVDLIVENTIGALVKECRDAFDDKVEYLEKRKTRKEIRLEQLQEYDPAEAVLKLKVLDPAMGSGHFLVTAADYLSDQVLELMEHAKHAPEWADGKYESPLVKRISNIQQGILERARDNGWKVDADKLDQKQIVRRIVLKRCIYGVDKNPMAVELSKLSLWLHSFTVGAPLSFLDHHMRCGDSLFGQRVNESLHNANMFIHPMLEKTRGAIQGMKFVENQMDTDIEEVHASADHYREVAERTGPLRKLMDFLHGLKWRLPTNLEEEPVIKSFLDGNFGNPQDILVGDEPDVKRSATWEPLTAGNMQDKEQFSRIYKEMEDLCREEKFFHWEIEFLGVWKNWESENPEGGFDAVIGNPPWDRIKVQEVEWFAARDRENWKIAAQSRAADRKRMVRELRDRDVSLAEEYDRTRERAEMRSQVVRKGGHYPLMGGGDINIYSLFVERARMLVKPSGIIGLLTPSGIYGDKTASPFFREITMGGHLSELFDFENKKIFFPDVHASFKFCVIVFGGIKRKFQKAMCTFFLHDVKGIDDPDRCFPLTPDNFSRVNPNTGTAPIFRTRRDAEIVKGIHARHSVLVNRLGKTSAIYPIKYMRMFDMTNDSSLFKTSKILNEEGFYPVENNRWKKGEEIYAPLYVGRMIWHFDHRASSVAVNPDNVYHAALSEEITPEQHKYPSFMPTPQYWVPESKINLYKGAKWVLGFRDVTNSTNARTIVPSLVPRAGYGNPLPLLLPIEPKRPSKRRLTDCEYEAVLRRWESDLAIIWKDYSSWSVTLCANLSSICLDYVARNKMQGTHLSLYMLEQLPIIARDAYGRRFGKKTADEIIRDHVLRLTYTSHDMAPFARDMGHEGEPFPWNEKERRHLRARLDALYFLLYGVSQEDAKYILSTFLIVKKQDKKGHNRYLTRDLILPYMSALEAGDPDTTIVLSD